MSKVKIQPNASGTANFTIAAPATNTDRTLSLPDVDATLLTTAGGTINGKVIIDGTQAIGSSSAANLTEVTTIYAQKYAPLRNSSSYGLYIGPASTTAAYLQVSHTSGSSAGTITLNPYGGYVTMPSQPMFRVSKTDVGYSSQSSPTVFNSVQFDIGSNYSTSTGRFTAPVSGVYFFSSGSNVTNGNPRRIILRKNGTDVKTAYADLTGAWTYLVVTDHVQMSAGDYVEVWVYNGTSDYGISWFSFSGHLVG